MGNVENLTCGQSTKNHPVPIAPRSADADKTKHGKTVFLFSGQGAQYAGMGSDLYNSPAARKVFKIADKIRPGTIEQCFFGTAEELAKTENTQPCLYCVDLAAAEALKEAGVNADMLVGFSLGELAALAFSGAVTYEDGFKLVCRRAKLMNKAAMGIDSGMVAVLNLSDSQVTAICSEFKNIHPVNFNCEGQVVVAGIKNELEQFVFRIKEIGGRTVQLKVSGAFHSPLMDSAATGFLRILSECEIGEPRLPVYSNFNAKPYKGDDAKELLAKQICSPVLWSEAIKNMILAGANTFIEVGPGKTLCGLVSRISNEVRVFNVEDCKSLKNTVEGVISIA